MSAIPLSPDGVIDKSAYESKPVNYQPTDEEERAIKLAESCFQKSKKARKLYDEKWLDYYRMFRGRQWLEARPSYRHSEVINLIFRAIQSQVPILTDTRPRPQFIPTEPSDTEIAQVLNDLLASDWNRNDWDMTIVESLYNGHFYGTYFASVGYDEKADYGAGSVTFESEDTFYCYPDPNARDINHRTSNYFVWAEPVAVDQLKRDYPKVAEFIKPDLIDFSKRQRVNFKEQIRYKSPLDNRTVIEGQGAYDMDGMGSETLKIEVYIHDQEFIEDQIDVPREDIAPSTEGTGTVYVQKLKYPKGRKICIASGVLLSDGPLPYEDKKFPYVRGLNYVLPQEFWGISEIEQLEGPQKTFNKLLSFALDVLVLMGNPIWKVSDKTVDTDNLFNRPGLIIECEDPSGVQREEGVQLQPYVLQLIDRLKVWFDDVSGSSDVSRGIRPEGVTAAAAIEALQEASNQRLRQKTRNLDIFLSQFGRMYVSRVFEKYTAPRVFRVTGQDQSTKYFKFHVEDRPVVDQMTNEPKIDPLTNQPMTEKVAKVQNYINGQDGKSYLGPEKEYSLRNDFDVQTSSGSSLPFEKNRIESQSYNLFDRGLIDEEEVLRNIKYQNADAVLKRMSEKKAQAALAQQNAPPKQ